MTAAAEEGEIPEAIQAKPGTRNKRKRSNEVGARGWMGGEKKILVAMACVYVDDLAAAGPQAQVQELWDSLRKEWDLRETGTCTEFLGIRVSYQPHQHGTEVMLDMEDYCREIGRTYDEHFPEHKTVPRYVPMTQEQAFPNLNPNPAFC